MNYNKVSLHSPRQKITYENKINDFLSLSMLLTSCAQDETRDNVISSEKTVSVNENKTSRIGLTTVEFIKEVYNPSVLNAEEATLRAWRQKIPTYYAA